MLAINKNTQANGPCVLIDFTSLAFNGFVGDDPFSQICAPGIVITALVDQRDDEDDEWDDIQKESFSNERIDAVAEYLRRTGQASE